MEGSNVSDCKKNDGLGRIRTGDLSRVKARVDPRLFPPCQVAVKQPQERQTPRRAPFDIYASAVLQALRACGATESLGSGRRLLRGVLRFCCDGLPEVRFSAAHHMRKCLSNVRQLT
jgi:hypothetical protein